MRFFLIAIFFTPIFCFTQSESYKFNFGVFLIPEINGLLSSHAFGSDKVNEKVGVSGGFSIGRKINERWSLNSGIGFGVKRYNLQQSNLIFNSDINPQNGITTSSSIESNLLYFDVFVPIIVRYHIPSNVLFSTGFNFNYFFADHSKQTIFLGNGNIEGNNLESEQNAKISYELGIGYNFQKTDFSIELVSNFYLNEYLLENKYLVCLGAQLTYQFKR